MDSETVAIDNFTQSDLLACLPRLHGFARALTRNREHAEDLVQDTVVRAVSAAHRFQAGTNLQAWMYTILRNQHYTNLRKNRIQIRSFDEAGIAEPTVPPSQESSLEFGDFRRAFSQLGDEHRVALTLVGINGLSYAEAAKHSGCPVGTIKSRVSRARLALRWILDGDGSTQTRRDIPALAGQIGGVLKNSGETLPEASPSQGRPARFGDGGHFAAPCNISAAASPLEEASPLFILPLASDQIREYVMQHHQLDHVKNSRLRCVFDGSVMSFKLSADTTLGEIAETLSDLSIQRYGHPVAIALTLPAMSAPSPF